LGEYGGDGSAVLLGLMTMDNLLLKYRSGEEIRKGDRVLFHGNQAEIEFVATDSSTANQRGFCDSMAVESWCAIP
jgi:hypothetical protein